MLNPVLDKKGKENTTRPKPLTLTTWLNKTGARETYRYCNPTGGKYTWKNSISQTRIDQIWVTSELREDIIESEIEDMEFRTGSDHNLIWAHINLFDIQRFKHKATWQRKMNRRKVFKYKEATQENWEDYSKTLDNLLRKNIYEEKELVNSDTTEEKIEEQINRRWEDLVRAILKAADEHLLYKMIIVSREEAKKITPKNPRFEDLRNLRRIARKARSNNGIIIDGIDQLLINTQIQEINRRQETEIPEITEMWSEEWIQACKNWHKAIERKIAEEAHIETQKNIIERVER